MILPRLVVERQRDVEKAKAGGGPPPAGPRLADGLDFQGWRGSLQGAERGFDGCVHVACSAGSLETGRGLLKHDGVHGAFGIHPLNASGWSDAVEQRLWDLMGLEKVVALGECGLDYFDKNTRGQIRNEGLRERQKFVFERQLKLAASLGVPLVVHTRAAEEDTLELMVRHLPSSQPVHVHCFTSSAGLARQLLSHFPRLYLGFTGVCTFNNARDVQEVVRETPLERMLLETDGPYMTPEPHRGRVCHPGHVLYVAEGVARLKGVPLQEVLGTCRKNTRELYGF